MSTQVPYESWPRYVKVVTAISNPKFVFKSPTLNLVLGYLLFIPGLLAFIYAFFAGDVADHMSHIPNLGYMIVGIGNIIGGYAIKWIADNSSWEERFDNTSTTVDKIIWFLVTGLLVLCLYWIIAY